MLKFTFHPASLVLVLCLSTKPKAATISNDSTRSFLQGSHNIFHGDTPVNYIHDLCRYGNKSDYRAFTRQTFSTMINSSDYDLEQILDRNGLDAGFANMCARIDYMEANADCVYSVQAYHQSPRQRICVSAYLSGLSRTLDDNITDICHIVAIYMECMKIPFKESCDSQFAAFWTEIILKMFQQECVHRFDSILFSHSAGILEKCQTQVHRPWIYNISNADIGSISKQEISRRIFTFVCRSYHDYYSCVRNRVSDGSSLSRSENLTFSIVSVDGMEQADGYMCLNLQYVLQNMDCFSSIFRPLQGSSELLLCLKRKLPEFANIHPETRVTLEVCRVADAYVSCLARLSARCTSDFEVFINTFLRMRIRPECRQQVDIQYTNHRGISSTTAGHPSSTSSTSVDHRPSSAPVPMTLSPVVMVFLAVLCYINACC